MNKQQIIKTGNKGVAKYELIISDNQGNTSSVYASKKNHLLEYIETHYNN